MSELGKELFASLAAILGGCLIVAVIVLGTFWGFVAIVKWGLS